MDKRLIGFLGILFFGFLMVGLVAGAGYNIVVPTSDPPADDPSGGGGGGTVENVTNVTSNETISSEEVVEDESEKEDIVGKGKEIVDSVIETAKKSWVWVGIGLVLLVAVIGGVVYFKKKS